MDVNDIGSAREFCRLIEHEPALVARLIGLANSVAFGVPGRSFNTLEQALTRIGLHQSAQICFALLCNQAMGTALAPRWRSVLWVHALCTAATANKLAREIEICDANDAYLGGLIYDIGLMALETVRPGTLDAIAATAEAEERPMRDVEDERVGAASGAQTRWRARAIWSKGYTSTRRHRCRCASARRRHCRMPSTLSARSRRPKPSRSRHAWPARYRRCGPWPP